MEYAAGVPRRRADARILLRMRIGMHETPSLILELPRSFLRDWVAAVHGVGIPGNLEPGQAEACPRTAAMTCHSKRKKTPAVVMGAPSACAKFTSRFLHLIADFSATEGIYASWDRFASAEAGGNFLEF